MRKSRAFHPTLKETPADAQVKSHVYMVRGGFIRQVAAGIYSFLPLGWRVIHKIENIVRQEMDRAGAQEVLMPAAIPAELWRESGRWTKYGPELLRFKDRKGADFCFGPTHEEVIVDMVRREIKSYRDLPVNLYQIQSKFRDELRPRAGLMRGREFIMKDAYSFDISAEAANRSYDAMYAAYGRIFKRCGLDFRPVEADTGAIGGSRSHEFQVLAETGEDAIVSCDHCDYAANTEQAEYAPPGQPGIAGAPGALELVDTPRARTIDEVSAFLGVAPASIIKSLVYVADDKPVLVLVRGDRAVNEIALKKKLGADHMFLAREDHVRELLGVPSGFVGPVGLADIAAAGNLAGVYADLELEGALGAVCGGNQPDKHYRNVELARDAEVTAFWPIRMAVEGDKCPRCDTGHFRPYRGIEVGHVFFLGTVYSQPMSCTFVDESGAQAPMVMGCYGIGITRIAAAAIEQNHDDSGIIWPMSIAPYEVEILPLQMKDESVVAEGERIYRELMARGVEVVIDDRDERPGGKFKDADLAGVPLRIAIGKRSLDQGQVEVKWRREGKAELMPAAEVVDRVAEMVRAEKDRLQAAAAD